MYFNIRWTLGDEGDLWKLFRKLPLGEDVHMVAHCLLILFVIDAIAAALLRCRGSPRILRLSKRGVDVPSAASLAAAATDLHDDHGKLSCNVYLHSVIVVKIN